MQILETQKEKQLKSSYFTGIAGYHRRESGDTSHACLKVTSAQAWFTSLQLQSHVTSAVSELQSALGRMREARDGEPERDSRG